MQGRRAWSAATKIKAISSADCNTSIYLAAFQPSFTPHQDSPLAKTGRLYQTQLVNPQPTFATLRVAVSASWRNKSQLRSQNHSILFLYLHGRKHGVKRNHCPSRNGSKGRKISGGVLAVLVLRSPQTDTLHALGPGLINSSTTTNIHIHMCSVTRLKQRPPIGESQIALRTELSSDRTAVLLLFD